MKRLKYDMTGWIMKDHGIPDSKITVLKLDDDKPKYINWICQCECGKIFSTRGTAIRSGKTKSCGCLHSSISSKIGKNNGKQLLN